MTCTERIVFTFRYLRETADSSVDTFGFELFFAAGEYFMGIRLMSDVPNKIVVRGVEDIMKRNSQFYDSQT